MRRILSTVLTFSLLLSLCLLVAPVHAEGWKFPNLNPFAKSKTPESEPTFTKPAPKKSTLPSVNLPGWSVRNRPAQPSPIAQSWTKFTAGTKNFFVKTNNFLNPWAKPAPAPAPYANRFTPPQKSAPIFPSLFPQQEEEPRQAESVSDFLRRPRPR